MMKKEYLVLAVIIGLLSAYLFMHKKDQSNYELPAINEVLGSELTAIEIKKASGTVLLTKEGDAWFVTQKKYPADSTKIEKLLGIIQSLTATALVSETGDLARYNLNPEKSIRVTAKKGGDIVRQFELGKPAPTYRHTFLKLSGDGNVYHAKGSFRSDFDQDAEALRDKKVLGFNTKEIESIVLEKAGISQSLVMKRQGAPDTEKGDDKDPGAEKGVWTHQDGSDIDNEAVDTLLTTLGSLDCSSYSTGGSSDVEARPPLCKVTLTAKKTMTLTLFDKGESDSYPGRSSENGYLFFLNGYKADGIISKIDTILGIKTTSDEE